jgi:hypothetical protein
MESKIMNTTRKLAACIVISMVSAQAVHAECKFSPDPNYGGGEWTLQNNDRVHWYAEGQQDARYPLTDEAKARKLRTGYDNTSGANDKMSSVKIVGSCKAIVYSDPNGHGKKLEISSDTPDLAGTGLDNVISMADCVCN